MSFDRVDPALANVLTLEIDREDSLAIVRCRGKLVSGVTGVLRAKVSPLIPESKRIVLDLTDLDHVDSTGLGALVRLYVSARSSGCELRLVNLGQKVRQLLALANLLQVFAVAGEHGVKII